MSRPTVNPKRARSRKRRTQPRGRTYRPPPLRPTRSVAEEVGGSAALALRLALRVTMLAAQQNCETLGRLRVTGTNRDLAHQVLGDGI